MKKWLALIPLIGLFVFCLSNCASNKKQLHIYCWADYVKPELIEDFESEYDCRVILDTFDSNESMYAKLKAGATGYDIIIPSDYFIPLMKEQGLIQPLNLELIPNLKYLDQDHPICRNRKYPEYSVPYMIGYTGVAYHKNKIKDFDFSWNIFAHQEFDGRMTMLNDMRATIGAALKYLGYSYNSINADEINLAAKQLIIWKRNLAKFENEQYKNGIASGEYLISQGYNGDITQVMSEDNNIGFFFPKEGVDIWSDNMVIPAHSIQVELAHHFINFLLDPEVATENMIALGCVCPNIGVYALLPKEIKNNPTFFPPKDTVDQSECIYDVGEHIVLYNRAWDYIKETN